MNAPNSAMLSKYWHFNFSDGLEDPLDDLGMVQQQLDQVNLYNSHAYLLRKIAILVFHILLLT